MNRAKIEREAIRRYGEQAQIDMMIEEMSELTKALLKWRRYQIVELSDLKALKTAENNVREEMADVQIMLDQMHMIFGPTDIEEHSKLMRLAGRLGLMEVEE